VIGPILSVRGDANSIDQEQLGAEVLDEEIDGNVAAWRGKRSLGWSQDSFVSPEFRTVFDDEEAFLFEILVPIRYE